MNYGDAGSPCVSRERPRSSDIRGILSAQANRLDVEAVRRTLARLEDALGVSDLLPVFKNLLASRG
jgi:hypothetical protein